VKKQTRLYLEAYCDRRGSIRPSAEEILSLELHHAFIRHAARLPHAKWEALYQKWSRRNGKKAAREFEREVSEMVAHPRITMRKQREALRSAAAAYLETLDAADRAAALAAWQEKHGTALPAEPSDQPHIEAAP